jgi:hypothetical protein
VSQVTGFATEESHGHCVRGGDRGTVPESVAVHRVAIPELRQFLFQGFGRAKSLRRISCVVR